LAPGYDTWTGFTISSGFVAGVNTLRFVTFNEADITQPNLQNPGGLRVELSGTADLDCNATRTRPTLQSSRQGSSLEMNWQGPGWALQGADRVTGPWNTLTRGSTANGTDYRTTVPTSGSARFFRLTLDCN
jgi:hypothetical protein